MDTPGNPGQSEFRAGWVVGRLASNHRRSRHEALIAMASRGGFLSQCGVFLSGENFHMQLSINPQLNHKFDLSLEAQVIGVKKERVGFPTICESCFPFFAYLLPQRCKKT